MIKESRTKITKQIKKKKFFSGILRKILFISKIEGEPHR